MTRNGSPTGMIQDQDKPPRDMLEALAKAVRTPELAASASGLDVHVRFVYGPSAVDIQIRDGAASLVHRAESPAITIAADMSAWSKVIMASPPPLFNSFTALQFKNGAFEVSGDQLAIAQARAALEDLIEGLRTRPPTDPPGQVERDIGLIEGRYAKLELPSESCNIYYEQSGRGRPLVLLHTAGADSRQYQNILSDVEIARDWRILAFDMPAHGRSFPLASSHGSVYGLTQAAYAQTVVSFIEQTVGEPVVLSGCSMGAAISLVVTATRPDLLLGTIALEPPLRSLGRRNPYLAHAMVANGLHNGAYVRGLMSPGSPLHFRKQAEWIYAQGGPGIYTGDLTFYSDEFDGHVTGPAIDGRKTSVQLLTGEYDYSATPEDGRRLSELIPGSTFKAMKGLGHFPMTENPDLFRAHFLAALRNVPC